MAFIPFPFDFVGAWKAAHKIVLSPEAEAELIKILES